jgi:exonuclease III
MRGGLNSHITELTKFLENNPQAPSLLCIQETHFSKGTGLEIYGYTGYHLFRDDRKGGGTSIYVHQNIPSNKITLAGNFEIIGVQINDSHFKSLYNIYSVYLPPDISYTKEDLAKAFPLTPSFIVGDFNAKNTLWGSTKSDSKGLKIENLMEDLELVCLNNGQGTRLNPSGSLSHIDLAFASMAYSRVAT